MTVAAVRGRATEAVDAPTRLLRSHFAIGHANRPRAAVDGHVFGLAAVNRSCARRAGIAGATHDIVLFVRLCHRAGVTRAAVGSPWPPPGAARDTWPLSHRHAGLCAGVFDRDADCRAL